jgi:ABC-type polysaccharide transport system permease subunit
MSRGAAARLIAGRGALHFQGEDSMQAVKKGRKHQIIKHMPLYVMMIPGLIYLVINNYLPLTGLQLAFKKFKYALAYGKARSAA